MTADEAVGIRLTTHPLVRGVSFTRSRGQSLDRDGYLCTPTIVTDINPHERLVTEEQFHPRCP